ncbi:MAG TPA: hypothetical protein VM010_08680 [Chitinophagaceae bacterium]|nr:hypothetical protein [Chitinophagaceae bacterium]
MTEIVNVDGIWKTNGVAAKLFQNPICRIGILPVLHSKKLERHRILDVNLNTNGMML